MQFHVSNCWEGIPSNTRRQQKTVFFSYHQHNEVLTESLELHTFVRILQHRRSMINTVRQYIYIVIYKSSLPLAVQVYTMYN